MRHNSEPVERSRAGARARMPLIDSETATSARTQFPGGSPPPAYSRPAMGVSALRAWGA